MKFRTLFCVILFSIAMGYFESAVVVYLRELYYPEGFDFPLKLMNMDVAVTEIFRELATIIMLLGISIIAGRKNIERFAYFLISFAVWDIFYYIFLKIILGWPESLLTWDILFLIPTIWTGPVIAPIINSLTMILLGLVIFYPSGKKATPGFNRWDLLMLISGSIIIIFSYILDYSGYMLREFTFTEFILHKDGHRILEHTSHYIPLVFNWYIFLAGEFIILLGIILYFIRKQRHTQHA